MTSKIECEGKSCKWWHSEPYIPNGGVCILYELEDELEECTNEVMIERHKSA